VLRRGRPFETGRLGDAERLGLELSTRGQPETRKLDAGTEIDSAEMRRDLEASATLVRHQSKTCDEPSFIKISDARTRAAESWRDTARSVVRLATPPRAPLMSSKTPSEPGKRPQRG